MITLKIIDIKHKKKFLLDKNYQDTIKTLKKYAYSPNIFAYDYDIGHDYYSDYELSQLEYWYERQYKLIK